MICAAMLWPKIRNDLPTIDPQRVVVVLSFGRRHDGADEAALSSKKDRLRFGAACLFYYSIWQQGKVRCLALELGLRQGLRERPGSGLPPGSGLLPGLGLGSLLLLGKAEEKLSGMDAQRLFRDVDDGVRACAFQVGRRSRRFDRLLLCLYQRSVRWLARHASLSGQPLSPPVRPPGRRLQMSRRRFRRGLVRIVSY